jgi:Alpha/beta hydrolase domain
LHGDDGTTRRFSQAKEENSRLTHLLLRLIAMAGACLWLPSGEQIARATTISANVDSTRVVRLGDKGYRYVEGSLNGTIARGGGSSGSYSAGFVLYYPTESNQVNGVGVVDYPNSVYYHVIQPLYGAPRGVPSVQREQFTLQFTLATTEDYLFQEGYTYMSIQWNKVVTDLFGATVPNDGAAHNRLCFGTIERASDAWEIMRDAGRFLKNPALTGLPARANQPIAVGTVIGTGYSQTGALANEFMVRGENKVGGGPRPFDAFLVQFMGAVCWQRTDIGPFYGGGVACQRVPTSADRGGAVGMTIASESDMLVRRGFFSRGIDEPGWVQYELAGFPHLTKPIFDVSGEFSAVNQTSVDARPFYRAAFRNIKRWLEGTPPPAGRYINGALSGDAFVITRDADGNATGGVRAPHMPSIDAHCKLSGAPLGSYNGVDNTDPANVFRLLAGVFTPFTRSQLDARYPASGPNDITHRVKRAARQLFEDDLILGHDLDAYKDDPHGPTH